MSRLKWDATNEKIFETGVDRGVLYVMENGEYGNGVVWNGLQNVQESPSGGEANANYADNIKYINLRSVEEFAATIEAYTYPDEFAACDGSAEVAHGITIGQQNRKAFGFCYRTLIGNDTDGTDHGYKIHIVYGATANPTEKSYETVNDNPDAASFSWDIETTPVAVEGYKPTASMVIDSTKFTETASQAKLKALEDILYGTDGTTEGGTGTPPRLPLPSEIITLMA